MKRKVISIMIMLAMLVPIIQPISLAIEEMQVESDKGIGTVVGGTLTDGDYQYRVDNNEVTITKYIGTSSTIVIPNVINGYSVTSIADSAFRYSKNLTSIMIPDNVTTIGDYAFADCSSLSNITISEGVTDLRNYVFWNCSSLQSITIPKSVATMSIGVFKECEKLENIDVDIDNQNYSSENGILFNKDKTTIIKYPEGKKDESYKISDSVTSVDTYAFSDCVNLVNITIPGSIATIGVSTFSSCASLTNVEILEGVESLESNAFYGCDQLANVEIPKSVTSIGSETFMYCKKLQNINVNEDNPKYSSESGVLFNKDKTALMKYPAGKQEERYVVPNTVISIGQDSFEYIDNLAIIMLDNVKSIDGLGIRDANSYFIIYGIEGSYVHTYAKQNHINFKVFNEGKCQEMLDALPNEIQVDLKESEYEKVEDIVEQKANEIWKQKGIDTAGMAISGYHGVGLTSKEALHTCQISMQYNISEVNGGTKYKTKEIKIIYNNSKNYNVADEQAINSKIPEPKYLTMDFSKCDDFDEMDNTVKNYYASSINDSSVDVKLFSGAGGRYSNRLGIWRRRTLCLNIQKRYLLLCQENRLYSSSTANNRTRKYK